MKRILDTVHGYIMVDDEYVTYIIDTNLFQRLRRIEQSSIRSVYPSARHDRFIHSLGVFHIGSLIVEHLLSESSENQYWGLTETTMLVLFNSYKAACLLHDIAHAPFSHSFEEYYGKGTDLKDKLVSEINSQTFTYDMEVARKNDEPKCHEYMSAYVAFTQYKNLHDRLSLDLEFIARMITGVYYVEEKATHQIHNCLISLLHGSVIDADRLDYACRDVWASGYCTSSIDLRRLISALHLRRNQDGEYVVCFESNSVNEIEGVLNVKDFQNKYVINHHVVCYDQWLLQKGAEEMASKLYPKENSRVAALGKIIDIDAVVNQIEITNPQTNQKYTLKNLSDDDIVFLLKQIPNNSYYEQWCSRQYSLAAIWKSKDEFYHFFSDVQKNETLQHADFEESVKNTLKNTFKLDENSIIVLAPKFKPRIKIDNLYLVVAGKVVKYADIYPKMQDANKEITFYYVYVPKKNGISRQDWITKRNEYVAALAPIIKKLYSSSSSSSSGPADPQTT